MRLDHVFMIVANEAEARERFASDGLRIDYARRHAGQGTSNVCACLDDVFLELLWFDGTEPGEEARRIGLASRATGGCPFGVAWRGPPLIETVPYAPPYLPPGRSIPVAAASVDPEEPMVFGSPGGTPPIDRPEMKEGRQRPDLATLGRCVLAVPRPERIRSAIDAIDGIEIVKGPPSMEMTLMRPDGSPGRKIVWR